jgi:membrane protein DedA with SNARE-associated domain
LKRNKKGEKKMEWLNAVDELLAVCMGISGTAILVGGSFLAMVGTINLSIENLLLVASALILPATGYLFGKSKPKV